MDPGPLTPGLDADRAERFAGIALGHVRRAYPYQVAHVLAGPDDALPPHRLHPVFHGSYDWHSCVHAHWMLARLLRRFPGLPSAPRIRAWLDAQFVPERVAGECAYFDAPGRAGFARPYGWAWLLALSAELRRHREAPRWAEALAPLAGRVADRLRGFLPRMDYPVRTGAHGNTAFALALAQEHAAAEEDAALGALLQATALRWYGGDTDCPAWGEPDGDSFLSPALVEAECMRRLLPRPDFLRWLDRFLPRWGAGEPAALFAPVQVGDRSDGKIAHLDGLQLSRAWCWRGIAQALGPGDPRRSRIAATVAAHLAAGLPHVAGNYMGEHWLASFAVLALGVD
ncbi:MAG: DUF2891 domain-containing protein [Xylophilus ampelinus]